MLRENQTFHKETIQKIIKTVYSQVFSLRGPPYRNGLFYFLFFFFFSFHLQKKWKHDLSLMIRPTSHSIVNRQEGNIELIKGSNSYQSASVQRLTSNKTH